jgi:hypothetical protein
VILERRRDDNNAIGSFVKEAGDVSESLVQKRIFVTDPNGGQRFRPEVAHFKYKRNLTRERQPPTGKRD